MLTDSSWGLLRRCLSRGANCLVQSDTPKGLNAEINFYNAVEEGDIKKAKEEVPTQQMMILTPKEDLVKYTSTEELANYAKLFSESVPNYLQQIKAQLEGIKQVILQFDIHPGKNLELKIASHPTKNFDTNIKKEISDIISAVPLIDVNGIVQFQIYYPVPN